MSDFVSDAWGWYVAILTIASIIACAALLKSMSSRRAARGAKVDTTGHVWDEDLSEWNNPLPQWWMWLFYITIIFSLVYLVLYPGLGTYRGYFSWSSSGQYAAEQSQAAASYGPVIAKFTARDVRTVAADAEARQLGQRLFMSYCAQCHGSDAGGSRHFPNLKDRDWLYGGDPEAIRTSITEGRNGSMPPMAAAVGGDEDVKDVAHYVLKMAGRTYDGLRAHRGKAKFDTICAACHGLDAKGNQQIGSANLTDEVWLHGGTEAWIMDIINKGAKSTMPAHKDFLDAGKIHLLTAYVYGLSNGKP
jgi:cytochrome c oxidase cbb3-type subunit III